jgi:hypothetical protein
MLASIIGVEPITNVIVAMWKPCRIGFIAKNAEVLVEKPYQL